MYNSTFLSGAQHWWCLYMHSFLLLHISLPFSWTTLYLALCIYPLPLLCHHSNCFTKDYNCRVYWKNLKIKIFCFLHLFWCVYGQTVTHFTLRFNLLEDQKVPMATCKREYRVQDKHLAMSILLEYTCIHSLNFQCIHVTHCFINFSIVIYPCHFIPELLYHIGF